MFVSKTLKLSFALLSAAVTINFHGPSAQSQSTNASVHDVIAASQALGNDPFTASINGSQATVYAYLPKRGNSDGCKIKALLAAKAVMDKFKNVVALNCYFLDRANQSQYVYLEVHTGDIRSYSNHIVPLPTLLASLSIKDTRTYAASRVVSEDVIPELQGKMGRDKREVSRAALQMLQRSGQVNVRPVIAAFRLEEKYAEELDVEKWLEQHNKVAQMLDDLTAVSNKKLRQQPAMTPVKQGDFFTERMTIYALIDKKKKAGQDTNKYEVRLNAIEEEVGGDKEVLKAAIDSLLRALN